MNLIESLKSDIQNYFDDKCVIKLDCPKNENGIWYLDVTWDSHQVIIQWKDGKGFGVSSSKTSYYGEGADEVYEDEKLVFDRVLFLLLFGVFTSGD